MNMARHVWDQMGREQGERPRSTWPLGGPASAFPYRLPYLIRGIDGVDWHVWEKAWLLMVDVVPASPARFTPKSCCEWPGSEIKETEVELVCLKA